MSDRNSYFIKSLHKTEITFYDDYLMINRTGSPLMMAPELRGEKKIPYKSITALQYKPATSAVSGYIQLTILGSTETRFGVFGATQDSNSIMFIKKFSSVADEIKQKLEEIINSNNKAQNTTSSLSVADEILKFKELLDSGIITDEEFNNKKRDLLNL